MVSLCSAVISVANSLHTFENWYREGMAPGGSPMLIAKITKSNSHVDYFARVLDSLETSVNLAPADIQFGQFVKIKVGDEEVIGVIYNSQLINPEYGNYGPRLSTPAKLNTVFSPDYLNEQGVLISILLLGWKSGDESRQDTHVMTHAGLFAFQLLSAIVDQLERLADEQDRARLDVLRKALAWRQTIGKMG
jgi:hypothetical protein